MTEKIRVTCANCGFLFETKRVSGDNCPKCGSNALDEGRKKNVSW